MGLTASSLNLTQYDIEDVQQHCGGKFTSREIQALYQRFRALDKKHKGFITEDELMAIPELAISPLAPRIVQMFQNQNFLRQELLLLQHLLQFLIHRLLAVSHFFLNYLLLMFDEFLTNPFPTDHRHILCWIMGLQLYLHRNQI